MRSLLGFRTVAFSNRRVGVYLGLCLGLGIAGCGPGAAAVDGVGMDSWAAQEAALKSLEAETGNAWTVRWHPDLHTPAVLEGKTAPLVQRTNSADRIAQNFLAGHAALFRMRAPRDEMAQGTAESDELGMVHVRYQQQLQGVPVWEHELKLHFDASGALVRIDGRYVPLPLLERAAPVVTMSEAADIAARAMVAGAAERGAAAADLVVEKPSLVVDPVRAVGEAVGPVPGELRMEPRLAWRVEAFVSDPAQPARREVFVDAKTAEPYRVHDFLDDARGTGKGALGEAQSFEVAARGRRFYLEDASVSSPAQKVYSAGYGARLPGTEVSSPRADQWDLGGDGAGAAVDAQVWLSAAEGYYARTHGRKGALDDGAGLRATVHYGSGYANAFWNGRQLVFGDGDHVSLLPLAGALDVVAHELTHAVSGSAAHLGHDGEPGALNEAISDIFACFVEHAVRPARADWSVGEDVVLGKLKKMGSLRDLADPHRTRSPAHKSEQSEDPEDSGQIHFNSTIPSHAAYLLTVGGQNVVSGVRVPGIGQTATERIFYRALVRYLGPASDFRDAADATVAAARDLHGLHSRELAATRLAWMAVGVLGQ